MCFGLHVSTATDKDQVRIRAESSRDKISSNTLLQAATGSILPVKSGFGQVTRC